MEELRRHRTPFYFYDTALLRRTLDLVKAETAGNPDWHVHYAVKANFNPGILRIIAAAGLGADCVSGGEIRAALEAGFPAASIFFAGVGKSDEEITLGLEKGIGRFNVESVEELKVLGALADERHLKAPISLRINPDIGAHTHANITTGLKENKFGISHEKVVETVTLALQTPGIEYKGLHFHIGSQVLDMDDFTALCNRVNVIMDTLEIAGLPVGDIDVGGGLGISYEHPNHMPIADFKAYFDTFRNHLKLRPGQELHFEPGRSIVAPCGSLVTKVLYVKEGDTKKFAIVDGSMTELIRPALYRAYHRVENISSDEPEELYDVVGPVCESSDVFVKGMMIDRCHRGDLLVIRSAGAYGEAMASRYNCRPLPEAVLF